MEAIGTTITAFHAQQAKLGILLPKNVDAHTIKIGMVINVLLVASTVSLLLANAQITNIGLEQAALIVLLDNMTQSIIDVFVLQENIGIIINVINAKNL